MADCRYLNYTWAWLALQFIGSNPEAYGIKLGTPNDFGAELEHFITDDMLVFIESQENNIFKDNQGYL